MTLDYFYGQAGELFSFYRIPKALFQEPRFQNLSTDAKTLYGILLDRMSLSVKNGWLDEQNRVFIIFTIEDVKRALCCADNKATKLLRELEKFGLIERKRRGLGKPSLVYVKNFSAESSKSIFQNRDFHDSGGFKNASQDPSKSRCNKTKENDTELSETEPFYSEESDGMSKRTQLEEYFLQSLEVDLLLRLCPDDEDELHINEREAAVVRIIFDKYVHEGYGPQHIATYLNDNGYRARSGKCWHPASIRGMVRNLTYTGVLRCGDAHSELLQELQIIPAQQFEAAQRIRENRSNRAAQESEYRVPLNIHGQSLLSGNAYCGHCGAKLTLTSSRKWRKLSDGTLDDTLRVRYTCYGKLRKQTGCTGQTGYTVHILDEIIDKSVRQIFSKMRGIPKEQIITRRYEREVVERKNHLQTIQVERDKAQKDLISLKAEILACIKGESVFPKETLAEMITAQEEKLRELDALYESSYAETEKTAELMDNVSKLYEELISFSDLYDSASFEAKKMIVNQLIRRVDVYRGYQLNITFNFDLTPYIEGDDTAAC